jgi:hypothetical protein
MKNFTQIFILLAGLLITQHAFSAPRLSSFPSAPATIFLDFDGHTVAGSYWNSGATIQCLPAALSDAQITEIFYRVSEDYRPFEVNITTDSTVFLTAPYNRRVRIIVTPTSSWTSGVGGISYIGSFTWGDDTPGFVFSDRLGPNNVKYIAECCTHESGHTLGLSHQSTYDNNCNLIEQYNLGTGTGQTAWAPVMGNSYYRNMTGWNDGPTPYGCANTQDNLTIITSANGFSYRADDYTETLDAGTFRLNTGSFDLGGIISTNTDKDAFSYVLSAPAILHLDVVPFSVGANNTGANLDIKVSMYKGNSLIRVFDPSETMSVTIDTSLTSGTYYFVVDGSGNQFTSNYGSLGSYRLNGFNGPLPIHEITLSADKVNNKHQFKWNVVADEPVQTQELQVSDDGTNFKSLAVFDGQPTQFSYLPTATGTLYYRLKVVSVVNETAYSNVVALKSDGNNVKPFTVSTLVRDQIIIHAPENFRYAIFDGNGRIIATGTGSGGTNYVNMYNKTAGFYVIQMFTDTIKQSERIIKQ